MFFPVGGDGRINVARFLVKDWLRVAIGADGAVNSLPNVELFAGSRMGADRQFILVDGFGGSDGMAEVVAKTRLQNRSMRSLDVEGILVGVQIDVGIGVKVHRIGAG